MSLLSRLFGGGGGSREAASETYKDFRITPEAMAEGGQFRLAARIEKEEGGETLSHHLIRADVFDSREAAEKAALTKARQVIDEQGERLFR